MGKMSITSHENRLKNMNTSLSNMREEIARLKDSHERLQRECAFLRDQIHSAKVTGKDGFDATSYKRSVSARGKNGK